MLSNKFFFITCLYFTFSYQSVPTQAQKLEVTLPFEAGTPFLEPDGRREVLKLADNSFIVVTKVKGSIGGDAACILERFDAGLKLIFKTNFSLKDNEEIKEMYCNDVILHLLVIVHDTETKTSSLFSYNYNILTGIKTEDQQLGTFKVNKWQAEQLKGAVKLTFENYVGSIIGQNYITPPEYQYEIRFSPDSNKILAYIFDYSKKNLSAYAYIFNKKLDLLSEGAIPVDNNFVNYGLHINNAGEIIILNGDRKGRIVVVEYNLQTQANKFLDIQYASAHRECLKLQVINDDEVYVGNIVTSQGGKLLATMYSKFNFKTHRIDKINYHNISDSLNQVVHDLRIKSKVQGEENWLNYELTNFFVDSTEKITLMLEKREIQSPEFVYDHTSVLDINKWTEGSGRVSAEGILVLCYNKEDQILFENYCPKAQTADIISGLNCASFSFDNKSSGRLRIIYSTAENSSGIFNTLHFLEWDKNTGALLKDLKLENPEGVGLLRNYTIWYDHKLILCGRKGLMGKKSFISAYSLE